jgi:ABC-type polysaccharide/polyol phosphate export permease
MIDWLPKRLQALALLIPTADCTELIRSGYFGESIRTHYELGYLLALNLVLTFVSLAAVKGVSTTVEGE